MIGLKINNEWLDMSPDTQISIRIISPAFSRDLKDNSHSLSFNIPDSDWNRLITGYYSSPQVKNAKVTFDADLYFDSNILFSGELDITSAQFGEKRQLTGNFRFGIATLATSFRETKLVDVDLGGQRDIAGVVSGSIDLEVVKQSSGDLAIEINGILFIVPWPYGVDEEGVLDVMAYEISVNTEVGVDVVLTGTGSNASLNLIPSAPATLLDVNTNPPANTHQWVVVNQVGQGSIIHDALIGHMNTVAQAPIGTYDYTFFPIWNPIFYNELNPDYLEYINYWDWDNTTFLKNSPSVGEAWRNTAIPFPKVAYLLDQALAHFGFTNISNFTSSPDFQKLHFYNNRSIDQVRDDGAGEFNGFQSYIDLRDHIPSDFTISDLLIYIRDTFNVLIDIDYGAKQIDFIPINGLSKNQEIDWRDKTLINSSLKRKPTTERGVQIGYKEDDKDARSQLAHQAYLSDYITGEAKHKIVSNIAPLFVVKQIIHPSGSKFWMVPDVQQIGQTPYPDVESDGYNLRSILFQGIQKGSDVETYPLATWDVYDYDGNIISNWGLAFHRSGLPSDEYSLIKTFFEPLLSDTEEEAELDQLLLLHILDLMGSNCLNPHRIRTTEGEIRTLIRKLSVTLGMNGIISSTANLLKT